MTAFRFFVERLVACALILERERERERERGSVWVCVFMCMNVCIALQKLHSQPGTGLFSSNFLPGPLFVLMIITTAFFFLIEHF